MADDDVHPRAGIPLAPLTTLGIGGPADWFVRATSAEQVGAAVRWCRDRDLSLFVLGGGSNLVIADDGVKALVLQVAIKGVDFLRRHADILARVGAGSLGTTWWQRPSGTDSRVLSVYQGSLAARAVLLCRTLGPTDRRCRTQSPKWKYSTLRPCT